MMTITVELPLDTGELVEKALDKARDGERKDVADLEDSSWSKRQADAFVNLVNGYLSGESSNRSDNYLVTIHVDETALAGGEGRSGLPIETVRRLCCDGHAVVITEDEKGQPRSVSRRRRTVPTAVERAVRARDRNCCRFPGCHHRRFTHCHHIEHWANGGEHQPDNLMLLCTKHHTLVHEGGFRIEKDYRDDWFFVKPDGVAVPTNGYHPRLSEDPPAGGLLSVAENTVKERAPPVYLH